MIITALSAWWWANYFTCLEVIQLSSHQAILGKLLNNPTFAKKIIFPVIFNSSNWYFYPHCISFHININFSSFHKCITVNHSFTWHESSLTPFWSSWSWRRFPASWWKCLSTSWMIIPGCPSCPKVISLVSWEFPRILSPAPHSHSPVHLPLHKKSSWHCWSTCWKMRKTAAVAAWWWSCWTACQLWRRSRWCSPSQ